MDLESSLKNYLAMQDGGGRRIPYLAVIHRLDQPVEGILVFGKTPEAAKSLSAQITAGKMEKIYLAVTYGKQAEAGKKEKVLEDYLKKDGKSNTSSVVNAHTPGAKKARLSYEVLGMPLAGERKYGAGSNVTIGAGSLALCAASLTFFHPITGKVMKFVTNPEGAEFKGISIPQM